MIDFLNNLNFSSLKWFSRSFISVNVFIWLIRGLFSKIDKMIYIVFCTFAVCFGYLTVFVDIRQSCFRIFVNSYAIFRKNV